MRLTVSDVIGQEELERDYEPFRVALQEALDMEVEFFPVESLIAVVPALLSNQTDLIFSGASEYLLLKARAKAVPVVALARQNYHTVFVVRADSGIKSLTDLKGKTVAMHKVGGTPGHIWPSKMLMEAGLDVDSDINVQFLSFKGFDALRKGEVDAWVAASFRYEEFLEQAGLSKEEFPAIVSGEPLPDDIFAANVNLDPKFIDEVGSRMIENSEKLVQAMLVAPENDPKFRDAVFIPPQENEYDQLREIYYEIGQEALIQ
ncbi:MAG: PhnD/SsuA/transferrin family substrate-binding protein [Coleofasciculaceae cyanobacterium SM2_3_26]|nr:PhnD/SsuA/transferrin family substrate-binding protein [Coleofasciculaceae cyanobacterium SM2_3_26]